MSYDIDIIILYRNNILFDVTRVFDCIYLVICSETIDLTTDFIQSKFQ